MNDEQKAAYVMAQAACALIEVAGMIAANQVRQMKGHSLAYDEEAFNSISIKYGIHHNAVIGLFHS